MKRIVLLLWDLPVPVGMPEDTPAQRANKRRALMIRTVVFILLLGAAVALPAIIANDNPVVTLGIIVDLLFMLSTLVINRFGFQQIAGTLCILSILIAILSPVLVDPLDPSLLPLLNMLVIAIIVTGLVLPRRFILLVGCINAGIIFVVLFLLPHAASLDVLLRDSPMSVSVPPIVLEIVVAFLTFILIRQLQKTIEKSEQQEEMIRLQRLIAAQEQREVEQARLLEEGIIQIAQTLMQISRGNLEARAMVTQGSVLWPIAGPLNTLLNRARDWRQSDIQYRRMQIAAQLLAQQIQIAWQQRMPVQLPATDTPLDSVTLVINQIFRQLFRSQTAELPRNFPSKQ